MSSEDDYSSLSSSITVRIARACLGITLSSSIAFSSVRLLSTAMHSNSLHYYRVPIAYNVEPRIITPTRPSVYTSSPQVHPQALTSLGTLPTPNQQLDGHQSHSCPLLPTSGFLLKPPCGTLYTNLAVSNNQLATGSGPVQAAAAIGSGEQAVCATAHTRT